MIGRIIETRSIFISFFNSLEQPIKKDKISGMVPDMKSLLLIPMVLFVNADSKPIPPTLNVKSAEIKSLSIPLTPMFLKFL